MGKSGRRGCSCEAVLLLRFLFFMRKGFQRRLLTWRRYLANRILVVEDNDNSRSMFVITLQRFYGYETIEAATGAEALEKAISEKPYLILIDLALPDISVWMQRKQ
jgi:PleD family two-component response regulator